VSLGLRLWRGERIERQLGKFCGDAAGVYESK
jgi:hypothetical protein